MSFNASGKLFHEFHGPALHHESAAMIFPHCCGCGLDVGEGFQFAGEDGASGATQQPLPSTSPAWGCGSGGC